VHIWTKDNESLSLSAGEAYKQKVVFNSEKKKISTMKKILVFCIASLLIVIGCNKKDDQLSVQSPGTLVSKNMIVNNNLNTLNQRINLINNQPAYVFRDSAAATAKSSDGSKGSSVTIQLIARLLPPTYNDEVLQASHVRIIGNYAYVAYNTAGPRYLGGVDVVDVSSPDNPVLISSAVFINPLTNKGKDISSVEAKEPTSDHGNALVWITGADETSDSAFVEQYELNASHQFESSQSIKFDLQGYVGTDVRFYDNKVYVTSGIGGGLTVLDSQMRMLSFLNIENARSVDVNKDFEIALGGDPGHLYNPGIWDKEIGGTSDPGAKSIIRLHNQFALAALGEDGLKCYDVSSATSPSMVSALPAPAVPEGGSELDYVTNGVSVSDNGWVYIANGAGGVDVAKLDSEGHLTWMGNINLGASVNYVEANTDFVFVARGVLGLKILKVTEN
jgi:hypothetical protein